MIIFGLSHNDQSIEIISIYLRWRGGPISARLMGRFALTSIIAMEKFPILDHVLPVGANTTKSAPLLAFSIIVLIIIRVPTKMK